MDQYRHNQTLTTIKEILKEGKTFWIQFGSRQYIVDPDYTKSQKLGRNKLFIIDPDNTMVRIGVSDDTIIGIVKDSMTDKTVLVQIL